MTPDLADVLSGPQFIICERGYINSLLVAIWDPNLKKSLSWWIEWNDLLKTFEIINERFEIIKSIT